MPEVTVFKRSRSESHSKGVVSEVELSSLKLLSNLNYELK